MLHITDRKRSLRRLCFHRCLSTRGVCPIACWDTHPWADTHPRADTPLLAASPRQTPPVLCMLGYDQQAGSTHPTGMHSCYKTFFATFMLFRRLLTKTNSVNFLTSSHFITIDNGGAKNRKLNRETIDI